MKAKFLYGVFMAETLQKNETGVLLLVAITELEKKETITDKEFLHLVQRLQSSGLPLQQWIDQQSTWAGQSFADWCKAKNIWVLSAKDRYLALMHFAECVESVNKSGVEAICKFLQKCKKDKDHSIDFGKVEDRYRRRRGSM